MFKEGEHFKRRTLKKLVLFCTRDRICPEMKFEVLKQAAREIGYDSGMSLKVTLSIQGWGDPEIFSVDGHRLKELTNVEEKVGAHATIVSVQHNRQYPRCKVLDEVIVKQILAREDRHLGELDKLDLSRVDLCRDTSPENPLLFLMKTSKEWRAEVLIIDDMKDILAAVASISNTGRIRNLIFCTTGASWVNDVNLEDAMRAWEISEQVGFIPKTLLYRARSCLLLEGGNSVNPMGGPLEGNWQHMVHFAQTGEDEQ